MYCRNYLELRSALAEFEERIATSSGGLTSRREFRHLEERLSSRIEELVFSSQHPGRRHRFDPAQILNLVHSGMAGPDGTVAVPILLSFMREDLPWIYELGMEGYRQITTGNAARGHESFRAVLHMLDFGIHSIGESPELHVSVTELRHALRAIVG
jgi:hypothetical protein